MSNSYKEFVVSSFTDADLLDVIRERFLSVPQAAESHGASVVPVLHNKADTRLNKYTVGTPKLTVGTNGKNRSREAVVLVSRRELEAFEPLRKPKSREAQLAELKAAIVTKGFTLAELGL